jgi:SHS2 domain-containing protein
MFRWVDHTAEVELEIEAGDEREVFADALTALAELLGADTGAPTPERRRVTATAPDRATQLAAWLEELVFLAETDGFVATRLEELDLGEGNALSTVAGTLGEPPPLIKGVTYHCLAFEPTARGYRAAVVFDV